MNGYEAKVRVQLWVPELGHAQQSTPDTLSLALWAQRQCSTEKRLRSIVLLQTGIFKCSVLHELLKNRESPPESNFRLSGSGEEQFL